MFVDPEDFTPDALRKLAPVCGECGPGTDITLAQAEHIYPHRPDLWDGRWYWKCNSCDAYVGTHKGTLTPLGLPAGAETRRARREAHAAFDPLWQKRQRLSNISTGKARGRGYRWLAEQLGIAGKDCHISHMDAATARRVVEVCRRSKK